MVSVPKVRIICTFGSGFHQRFGHGQPQASAATGDGVDAVCKIKLFESMRSHPGKLSLDVLLICRGGIC